MPFSLLMNSVMVISGHFFPMLSHLPVNSPTPHSHGHLPQLLRKMLM
ncbi:unnamed protein product [Brugia timori]|uniref:Uncharacterized protein n=1 Tax=Brugia timori TaxID=42155 RepID=A0A3P7VNJ3_9BILA|nr:unnamed protein product [Brugia timori]